MNITVPFISGQLKERNKQALLKKLKQLDADEVFVAWCDFDYTDENIKKRIEVLKTEEEFLTENGYSVAIWLPTLSRYISDRNHQPKVIIDGTKSPTACPLCENFCNDYSKIIKALATAGFKRIILDER